MRSMRVPILLLLVAGAVSACARSDFATAADLATVEAAFDAAGIQVCETADLDWSATPGFDHGRSFRLNTDCSTHDPNRPGATVSVAAFDSTEARDAAQLRFLTQFRRHPGTGAARTLGPLLITVDGSQESATVERLRTALSDLDAR